MYQSITETKEFQEGIKKVQGDILLWIRFSGRPTSVNLPRDLVDLINRRGDAAYESVKRTFTNRITPLCPVRNWERGKDENEVDFIKFDIVPGLINAV
jgi:hypothetical protein